MIKIQTTVLTKKGNYFDVFLRGKRIVCDACNGSGTELRGGLKGCVMSDESMADPDFRAAYFGGDYDVHCSECKGLRVIEVVDEDLLTKKMAERYWRYIELCRESDAADAAEKRYFERARGDW